MMILTFKLGSECVTFVVTNVCYNKPVCNEDDSAGFKLVDAVLVLVGIVGYAMLGFGYPPGYDEYAPNADAAEAAPARDAPAADAEAAYELAAADAAAPYADG